VLLTGGEDSKLNVWANPPLDPISSPTTPTMDVDGEADEETTPARKRVFDVGRESLEQVCVSSLMRGACLIDVVFRLDSRERKEGCRSVMMANWHTVIGTSQN
jgi:hypothetical protein